MSETPSTVLELIKVKGEVPTAAGKQYSKISNMADKGECLGSATSEQMQVNARYAMGSCRGLGALPEPRGQPDTTTLWHVHSESGVC